MNATTKRLDHRTEHAARQAREAMARARTKSINDAAYERATESITQCARDNCAALMELACDIETQFMYGLNDDLGYLDSEHTAAHLLQKLSEFQCALASCAQQLNPATTPDEEGHYQ